MFCSPEIRRPKAEIRIPRMAWFDWLLLRRGGYQFGLRVSFGLRSSDLGFGMARTDFRAALGCDYAVANLSLIHI